MNKQKLIFSLLFVFSLIPVHFSSAQDEVCKLNEIQPDEAIPSDDVNGNYWTNLLDDNTVLFTADGGIGQEFEGYDLKNKKPIKLTRTMDPFPVPDGRRLYVHPQPLRFYSFDEVTKKTSDGIDQEKITMSDYIPMDNQAETINTAHKNYKLENKRTKRNEREPWDPTNFYMVNRYSDLNAGMQGYYESVGVIESKKTDSSNYSIYRILTGAKEGTFNDYKVTFNNDGSVKTISPGKPRIACSNLRQNTNQVDLDFDTPMISPIGNEFSIIDRKTQTTKIMKLDPVTGDCTVAEDLGFMTGKPHFSKDGSKLAFHSQILNLSSTSIENTNNKAYVYERKTHQLTSLHVGALDETVSEQYPAFLSDGRIIYQRVQYDYKTQLQHRNWVIVDPAKLNRIDLPVETQNCAQCSIRGNQGNFEQIKVLGELYQKVCKDAPRSNPLSWILNIDPEICKTLVNQNWEKNQDIIFSSLITESKNHLELGHLKEIVTKNSLLAACPKIKTSDTPKINLITAGRKMRYPAVVSERCVICHTQDSPHGFIPFDQPELLRKMKAIGKSAEIGAPFHGMTFVEQLQKILEYNVDGKLPPPGVPKVPADGPRLNKTEMEEILHWVDHGS